MTSAYFLYYLMLNALFYLFQVALNGNLLKTRHKTEIESMLINTRKCLIDINSLTSKTKAFLIMTIDLYYSNFNDSNLEKSIEKIYEPYLLECANKNISRDIKKSEESEKVIKLNSRVLQQPTTSQKSTVSNERRYERQPSVPKSVPVKLLRPPLRKSEPIYHSNSYNSNIHQPTQRSHSVPQTLQQHKSSQKKISPKELRTRTNSNNNNKTSPRNDKVSSISPRALNKVESAIDKLQIKSSNDIKQMSNTSEPVPQSENDENLILKQQNSIGNSVKSTKNSGTSKVYFKEENVENLSWNGETSFEDPENPADPTSPNQYSSSFLNFLSNN